MKLRILYLTYDVLKDPLGQSQVLPYLEGLAAMMRICLDLDIDKARSCHSPSSFIILYRAGLL